MTYGLTKVQSQCLAFIRAFSADHGYAPSYAEIAAALGYSSKGNVCRIVKLLAERGFVQTLPGRGRTIVLAEHAS